MIYSREALRRLCEQEAAPPVQPSLLEQIPAEAPMDAATITVWNGQRWVAFAKWRATAPVVAEAAGPKGCAQIPADAACVVGDCGDTRVWLVRDGQRWLMYVGSRWSGRRRDFASPYLDHAIRTAEQWYGAPPKGWRAEKGCDEEGVHEAASVSPQGADHAEAVRE